MGLRCIFTGEYTGVYRVFLPREGHGQWSGKRYRSLKEAKDHALSLEKKKCVRIYELSGFIDDATTIQYTLLGEYIYDGEHYNYKDAYTATYGSGIDTSSAASYTTASSFIINW